MNKPNCGNCPHYIDYQGYQKRCDIITGVAPGSFQIGIPYHINIIGCLSHPGAREYLNEAVILYLESVEAEFQKHFLYAEGKEYEIWGTALNRTREAILLIKGDKT